jgi:hypothetical protein
LTKYADNDERHHGGAVDDDTTTYGALGWRGAEGAPEDVVNSPDLRRAYLGIAGEC